jgi:mRNA-degrading endonuclease RelE of RelBE toxin-antitoxin system
MKKLFKKNPETRERIIKKINEIINSDVEHYKNLRKPLQHLKRVHIGEKVLVFSFDKTNRIITFENFDHHDRVYV